MLAPRQGNPSTRQPNTQKRPPTAERRWPSASRSRSLQPEGDPAIEGHPIGRPAPPKYHIHRHYYEQRGQSGASTGFATGFAFGLGWMAARLLIGVIVVILVIGGFYALLSSLGIMALFG